MSKPKVFEKPIGVKDYLPHAVTKLRQIENQVLACMRSWGYEQIMTPTMEYYDTVGVASSTSDQKLFKLLNNRGTTLVLRSDMTAPIARVVSSVLKDVQFPIRLSYHSSVYRAIEEEAGRDAEFFQTGVELVGDASPDADAEVVALAIASLKAAGVKRFKIAIGHVGFLNGLFEAALPGCRDAQEELKAYLLGRDYVGYRERLRSLTISDEMRGELEGILRLRGGQEICNQAMALRLDEMALSSIRHLCEMWDVLDAYGVCEHALIDLTMIGDFQYYTGMTFEAYAADLGFPVASGGRYDNLLKQFGRPAPATGFALKTTRILELIGDAVDDAGPARVLIGYDPAGRAVALEKARELREAGGASVTVMTERMDAVSQAAVREAASAGGQVLYKGVAFTKLLTYFGGEREGE
ncbi:ATP phosphoribosyltransferase regulatory subunit [Paenibacillus sp. UNC496MF]|uniref:ATP phosphoribosyltransferase regulatory subunit n=1 Tax=Paenibacillus sp. UNC496MF TaxID=1502753 RepID=UPI0008E9B694|nr:ATP phosphoribosyltransferase regulatory subunit [Paenibacillus sp. UNC496MF]SFI81984.1 ATP phosphoribosyltransferase regulatory subunit [Paenibacillus sp. UNC496MF]